MTGIRYYEANEDVDDTIMNYELGWDKLIGRVVSNNRWKECRND